MGKVSTVDNHNAESYHSRVAEWGKGVYCGIIMQNIQ